MTDAERRSAMLAVMQDFSAIGEAHKRAVATVEASAIPAQQRALILHILRVAEKSARKAAIIVLSWSIGAYDPNGSGDAEEDQGGGDNGSARPSRH